MIRWITGNADPTGRLPWPFGTTDYLVWWGSGSWPLWLVSIPALAYLLLAPGTTTPRGAWSACWTLAAWAQVALPGLYWPHYYLLPIAGAADRPSRSAGPTRLSALVAHTAGREPASRRRRPSRDKDVVRDRSCWRPSRSSF